MYSYEKHIDRFTNLTVCSKLFNFMVYVFLFMIIKQKLHGYSENKFIIMTTFNNWLRQGICL